MTKSWDAALLRSSLGTPASAITCMPQAGPGAAQWTSLGFPRLMKILIGLPLPFRLNSRYHISRIYNILIDGRFPGLDGALRHHETEAFFVNHRSGRCE